jgi:hypothetical protein
VLVIALLVGVLLGIAAALVAPGAPAGSALASGPARGPRLELAPGERAVWSAWTGVSPAVLAIPLLALVPVLVMAVLEIASAYLLLVVLLVTVVVAGSLYARVWVDERGLTVRGPLGFPAYTVPLAEIAAVGVIEVSATGEYGGWGWRLGRRQRFGAIFRSGEALQVTRGDGRRFVVTVDGAAEAAAPLTALTDRAHRLTFFRPQGVGDLLPGRNGGPGRRWGYAQVVPSTVRRAGRVVHRQSPTRSTAPLRPRPRPALI